MEATASSTFISLYSFVRKVTMSLAKLGMPLVLYPAKLVTPDQ